MLSDLLHNVEKWSNSHKSFFGNVGDMFAKGAQAEVGPRHPPRSVPVLAASSTTKCASARHVIHRMCLNPLAATALWAWQTMLATSQDCVSLKT